MLIVRIILLDIMILVDMYVNIREIFSKMKMVMYIKKIRMVNGIPKMVNMREM